MAKVFFSYSHKDEGLRDQLETHLAMLRNQGLIESWHDRRIVAGSELDASIFGQLETADVILLLVSADFLASAYCYSKEMQRAMERHNSGEARVIPVILRACDWTSAPFGGLLAAPRDGKPIMSWPDTDEALADVAKQVRRAVETLQAPAANSAGSARPPVRSAAPAMPAPATSTATQLPRSANLRLHKEFTEKDRDDFLREAFEHTARLFEGSLKELQERNTSASFTFDRIDSRRFAAILYRDGKAVAQGSVRMDSFGGRGSTCIAFAYDANARSGSSNEMLHVEATDQMLYLKPLGMAWSGSSQDKHLSAEGAAEYLWAMFIKAAQGR